MYGYGYRLFYNYVVTDHYYQVKHFSLFHQEKRKGMVASRIKFLMEQRGISVRQMVATTGLSDQTIQRSRDARINRCTIETLSTIAHALGVRVKDLFEEGEDGGQPPGKES